VVGEPRSAVVVTVAIPAGIERIRRERVPVATLGVPPHVTVLSPFVPAASLDGTVRRRLASIAAAERSFDVWYRRVDAFPDALYLVPEPAEPFRRLVTAVVAAFPGYPPYGDPSFAARDVVPHLTIALPGTPPDGSFPTLADRSRRSLPFSDRARALTVLVEREDRRWRLRWRIPLRP
jgi:2'-5' RNA ligase